MKKLILKSIFLVVASTTLFAGGGGDILRASFLADQLEYQDTDPNSLSWDISYYIGYDENKIYIYSDGEKEESSKSNSQNELVYSRAIAPFWDIQVGVAYDKTENSSKTWGEIAISGLAPYFFETRLALLANNDGNIGLRTDFEYESLITQKLIFTPSLQIDAYTKDNIELGIGSGLSNITLGSRLRYEIIREFAPYIGLEWSRNYGTTNEISTLNDTYFTAGVRFWF